MKTLLTIFLLLTTTFMFGQKTVISGTIEGQSKVDLLLIYYILDKAYAQDSCRTDRKGNFRFENEYTNGIYEILVPGVYPKIPIIVNNEPQITIYVTDLFFDLTVEVIVSKENTVFNETINYLKSRNKEFSDLSEEYKNKTSASEQLELKKIQDAHIKYTAEYVNQLAEKNPTLFASKYLKSQQETPLPECENTASKEECIDMQYEFYTDHFFDNIDFGDKRMIRTESLKPRLDFFFDIILSQETSIIIPQLDALLQKQNMHPTMFKMILHNTTDKYYKANSDISSEIYIHLIDEYYAKGKAPWVTEEQLETLLIFAESKRSKLQKK